MKPAEGTFFFLMFLYHSHDLNKKISLGIERQVLTKFQSSRAKFRRVRADFHKTIEQMRLEGTSGDYPA